MFLIRPLPMVNSHTHTHCIRIYKNTVRIQLNQTYSNVLFLHDLWLKFSDLCGSFLKAAASNLLPAAFSKTPAKGQSWFSGVSRKLSELKKYLGWSRFYNTALGELPCKNTPRVTVSDSRGSTQTSPVMKKSAPWHTKCSWPFFCNFYFSI